MSYTIFSHRSCNTIFFFALILLQSDSDALDTLYANQELKDGDTLVSKGEMFELGFFSPGKSNNRYLAIWYKKISTGTVVWVANRETPIIDKSGVLKLSTQGNLVILSGGNPMVWSSNTSVLVSLQDDDRMTVVQLLDTRNLVAKKVSANSTKENLVWQSFDYIGDTFLPGMKFGTNLVTGLQNTMTSWKNPDDPSRGEYSNILNTNGYPQSFEWHGNVLIARLGPWNGLGFSGFPVEKENRVYSAGLFINEKEIYHKYELTGSVVQRVVLTWDGRTQFLQWIERTKDWMVYAVAAIDNCDRFALCGPYGMCSINKHPPCTCMEGFEPRNQTEWDSSDWGSGCVRKESLNCGKWGANGDGFWKLAGVKVPDTRRSWYNVSMNIRECEMECKRNCSCTGYSTLDIRDGGSGCLLWSGELLDTREFGAAQDVYIRMAASELQGHLDSKSFIIKRRRILIVVVLASSVFPLMLVVAYFCREIMKSPRMKGRGNRYVHDEKDTSLHMQNLDDLQFFSLLELVQATSNFNDSNKIGEGGFGPVYKGVLQDGRQIAVKRLSKTSEQGLAEFKNEVLYIAKLQHRNLVKLLRHCIHKNELILIYEYMPNKSLDYLLFDEKRSLMLDWPQRFNIIQGMARGILYLHQDSRLQIIHRDLKAVNILLDSDMNPKISDFGLARNFVGHDTTAKTKKVVGTYGYISPEYAVHGRFSIKSDVFSFGVLVLEIISGQKNKDFSHENHRDNLLGHAWRLLKEGRSIQLMSESLQASCVVTEVLRSIHVGLLCVQHDTQDRPTMLSVVLMLVSEGVLPQPKQPAFFIGENQNEVQSVSSVDEYTITQVHVR